MVRCKLPAKINWLTLITSHSICWIKLLANLKFSVLITSPCHLGHPTLKLKIFCWTEHIEIVWELPHHEQQSWLAHVSPWLTKKINGKLSSTFLVMFLVKRNLLKSLSALDYRYIRSIIWCEVLHKRIVVWSLSLRVVGQQFRVGDGGGTWDWPSN